MVLLIILAVVLGCVALMVVLGEKYGKPMEAKQQGKYSKIITILVFALIIGSILKLVITG